MPLYAIKNGKAEKVLPVKIDFEKTLQKLFENNLPALLDMQFVYHEYPTSFGGRIDTLAIDNKGNPCIIEYKKTQDDNVINQGLSYLRWLLDHKADFKALCDDKNIKRNIYWDSPRVICIAESYNKFDLDTVDILQFKVELFKYKKYSNNTLYLESEKHETLRKIQIKRQDRKKENIKESMRTEYSLNEHLKEANANVKELFGALREKILSLDSNISEEPKKLYIAYKLNTNFADIVIWKKFFKVFINVKSGELKDSRKIAKDLTRPKLKGHWGNGDYEVSVSDHSDIDYVFGLIKQGYDLNK